MSLADQLSDGNLDSCALELRQKAAVIMDREQIRDLLRGEDQRYLCRKLIKYYPNDKGQGLDSFERDLLCDAFARRIAGVPHWPYNMSSKAECDAFIEGVRRAYKADKIGIDE